MKKNLFSLDNKTALITGASGHLGAAIVKGLCEQGANVIINGRNTKKLHLLAKDLQIFNSKVITAPFDITDLTQIKQFFNDFSSPIDIIVNNAYNGSAGSIEVATAEDYIDSYNSSVIATHNIIKEGLSHLRKAVNESGDASVINIASMYGTVSPDISIYDSKEVANPPFYGTAKAALIQLTKYCACEFAHEKIRFNCISPGPFPAEDVQQYNPQLIQKIIRKLPMNRIGNPEEIKTAICFLASPHSSFVTGINIPIDGGWTAW